MSDQKRLLETLKAKAMLLIQRERELYTLRLGRERMMAWLHAFQRFASQSLPESGEFMCAEWTSLMIQELHYQTAAAFELDPPTGQLSLIAGRSHAPLERKILLTEAGRRLLQERRDGQFEPSNDPALTSLAQSLGMQRFLWFAFPCSKNREILLVAGTAQGVGGAQIATVPEDLINFTMLGRHLAALLSNVTLFGELESTRHGLQELFDHMRQAIVAFDRHGAVGSVSSQQAKVVFGREDLRGCSIRDLLYPNAPPYDVDAAAFSEWVDLAFATPPDRWASCEQYAPHDVVIRTETGQQIPLELEFRPLVRGNAVTQLMLLATDVSRERKLESAVLTHQAEQGRRTAAMHRLIAGGTQVFLAFVESTQAKIEHCEEILRTNATTLSIEHIDELFRFAHTLRGEARAFELLELEGPILRLEEDLNDLRTMTRAGTCVLTSAARKQLGAGLDEARRALERACEMLANASPLGRLVFDQVTVSRSVLKELSELAGRRSDRLGSLIRCLSSVPLGITTAGVVESAPDWAAVNGCEVVVNVQPRELMIPKSLASILPGVLSHLVRNAIAHGIETPEERQEVGKAAHGTIQISGEETEGGVCLIVTDDGRGLAVDQVLERARDSSVPPGDVTELVFFPGLSTRESPDALAGRGVGLDAVRTELAQVGYDVSLAFDAGMGTRVTILPQPLARHDQGGHRT